MAAKKHAHRYHRVEIGSGTKVWACSLPDCTHHMPKYLEKTINGRLAICWKCEKEFILDADALAEDEPRCFECRTGESLETKKIREYLASLTEEMK